MSAEQQLWGLTVSANKAKTLVLNGHLVQITQVVLSEGKARSVVRIHSDQGDHVLCALEPGKVESWAVDLSFFSHDVSFSCTSGTVDLFGYVVFQDDEGSGMPESRDWEGPKQPAVAPSSGEGEGKAKGKAKAKAAKAKKGEEGNAAGGAAAKKEEEAKKEEAKKADEAAEGGDGEAQDKKKRKRKRKNKSAEGDQPQAEQPAAQASTPEESGEPKTKKQKKAADNNNNNNNSTAKADKGEKPKKSPKRQVKGVMIQDVKEGTGKVAQPGSRVLMHYVGTLSKNGHRFDSSRPGKGFQFRLGVGEVIKGWDVGVAGMKEGGKRTLAIPAKLAYGSQGVGDIPPNSDLNFQVELLKVLSSK